ncbi:MAG TPA: CaiB/BaiF CoA-transferase family protein [Xanthobacteraceae bacterium]|nr:CaiB/BaiF CoA-transferase family protein [Xanthobacteraceae bacterium]
MKNTPLSHLRVLDMSRVLAGPWAGQTLGDLGADVIKIERPDIGDDTRSWGPPYLTDGEGHPTTDAAYFLCANRNKRSLAIDITHPDGQAAIKALAARSDILIENFKVGNLARYGLDYASLSAVNPGLIYCSITGFGQAGPYAQRAGYDLLVQAMGGLMSITGEKDDDGGRPQKVGVAITDISTGLYATVAILAAVIQRQKTGVGQHIDLSLLDVQVATLANQASNYLVSGQAPGRMGNAHPNIVPYQDFATADGHIIIAVGNDAQFTKLCQIMNLPDIAARDSFRTNDERVRNRHELIPLLDEAFRQRGTSEWVSLMETAGIPCGPINTMKDVFQDPHIRARNINFELPHGAGGAAPSVANPIRFSETPISYRNAPPRHGEHSREILEQVLCLSQAEIERLETAGVVKSA